MRQQAYEALDGLIKSNNNSSSGGGQSIDIEFNESFNPIKVKYNNNSVDVLQEVEAGDGTVFRIRNTDFNNFLINNHISSTNLIIYINESYSRVIGVRNPHVAFSEESSVLGIVLFSNGNRFVSHIIEVYPN